jgi:hypothetical protein
MCVNVISYFDTWLVAPYFVRGSSVLIGWATGFLTETASGLKGYKQTMGCGTSPQPIVVLIIQGKRGACLIACHQIGRTTEVLR